MWATVWVAFGLAAACGSGGESGSAQGLEWPDNTAEAVATHARIVRASYEDTVDRAEALDAALEALVDDPSEGALQAAREAWRASREPYLQTEVFRFSDGPIDNPEDGPESMLNAWPLDEQYIDYVEGDPDAGIINGDDPIDAETLISLNEKGGEKNIATGYHAIEFLLWGQDHSETGPGDRPYTDYVTDGSGTADNQDRRGEYLLVVGDLLVEHLRQVRDGWADEAAYRQDFEADPQAAFEKIVTGMIVLSGFETGGERLQAALDSQDQEDEHSCFSDNTHRDMIQDIQGVKNVWDGRYGRVDGSEVEGPGVRDVVAEVEPELMDAIDARIDESLSLAEALQPPFDQEIAPGSEGNARVQALIVSLREQEDLLSEVFEAFELSVPAPE